jgi:hypothetical protein
MRATAFTMLALCAAGWGVPSHAAGPAGLPYHMVSTEGAGAVSGAIDAVLDTGFAPLAAALDSPARWCDVLILHINTKYCDATSDARGTLLHVGIGKKYDQSAEEAYRVDFAFHVVARDPARLQVTLVAEHGPLGTHDYRIVFEAAPAGDARTSIRLSYAYAYGLVGELAMQAYLSTIGRDKVGFTVIGSQADGGPRYIGGMRGVVERNTMRYYLAIQAFIGALSAPVRARLDLSLRAWFAATERFPRQLHEIEQGEYLDMKHRESSRPQPKVSAAAVELP